MPFTWGIIGPGEIANAFTDDFQYVKEAECKLGPVFGKTFEHSKELADKHGGKAVQTIEELIAERPDAVYIATPHPMHHPHTLQCLENHIPVLCEKPLALNSEQVNHMIDTANQHQTFLMEGMWTRFLPSLELVLKTIHDQTIGEVLHIRADMSYVAPKDPSNRYFNPKLGGGSLLDLGIYPVYLSYLLLGKPISIHAAGKVNKDHIDETCGTMLVYEHGVYTQSMSSIITHTETFASIYGSKGTIHIRKPWTETPENIEVILHETESTSTYALKWAGRGFQFEMDEVIRCVRAQQTESSLLPHETSRRIIAIIDNIREQLHIEYPAYE